MALAAVPDSEQLTSSSKRVGRVCWQSCALSSIALTLQSTGRPQAGFAHLRPPVTSNVRAHMEPSNAIVQQARHFVEQLVTLPQEPADLRAIADSLRLFASSSVWQTAPYRQAVPGEELLYELALGNGNGPSLYLVSDGGGVTSPPHCHGTWAVIAGIRGQEFNHRYAVQSPDRRTAVCTGEVAVGPGQALTLGPEDVHSTEVRGVGSTFHLHLYGRPLNELPSFESRCYTVGGP